MDNTLVIYALIKSIYEEKKNYLDVFVPFLINSFPENQQECSRDALSGNLEGKYGLKVPQYTLNTIITRAVRSGFITQKEKKCFLTEKGGKFIRETLQKHQDAQRKINALIEDIKIFIKNEYQFDLDQEKISGTLNLFIKKYQIPLINFFDPESSKEKQYGFTKDEIYLNKYFELAKSQKPDNYDTLKKLFYGALISTVLLKKDIDKINQKFVKLQIYLDTNFMFSIMDLHYPHICKPAKEFFTILKNYGFQLKVFDFTINEIVRVLKGYPLERNKYFPKVKIDSIYSNLRNKGWTEQDCIQFISKIEQKIYDLGLKIEYTNIDLDNFQIDDGKYLRILEYKPDQNALGQKHDICAIEKIRGIRGKRPQREIENCIALFLTSDLKLARFDFEEIGHKSNMSVCEVVSDRFLTTLLWLKNPELVKEIPITMVLSTQSELLISRDVWDKFYINLTKLKNEGKISEEDIATLIYYHQLEADLMAIEPGDATPDFVSKEIEKSKKKRDEYIQKKITEQTIVLEEKYNKEIAKRDTEYLNKIDKIKNSIRKECEKKAKIYSYSVLVLIGIAISVLIFLGLSLIKIKILNPTTIALIAFIFQLFGIHFNILKWRDKLYDYFFDKCHKKKFSKLNIEERLK